MVGGWKFLQKFLFHHLTRWQIKAFALVLWIQKLRCGIHKPVTSTKGDRKQTTAHQIQRIERFQVLFFTSFTLAKFPYKYEQRLVTMGFGIEAFGGGGEEEKEGEGYLVKLGRYKYAAERPFSFIPSVATLIPNTFKPIKPNWFFHSKSGHSGQLRTGISWNVVFRGRTSMTVGKVISKSIVRSCGNHFFFQPKSGIQNEITT